MALSYNQCYIFFFSLLLLLLLLSLNVNYNEIAIYSTVHIVPIYNLLHVTHIFIIYIGMTVSLWTIEQAANNNLLPLASWCRLTGQSFVHPLFRQFPFIYIKHNTWYMRHARKYTCQCLTITVTSLMFFVRLCSVYRNVSGGATRRFHIDTHTQTHTQMRSWSAWCKTQIRISFQMQLPLDFY